MNIPIAMLHHVAEQPHPSLQTWCISHSKFLEFLTCIENKGLQTTTFQEIITQKPSPKDLRNRIIITFDDCAAELLDFAIPELVKRNMKAVFYMPSNHIDGENIWDIEEFAMTSVKLMNLQQLQYLLTLGMEVGSHGENHIRLNQVSEEMANQDITLSKKNLENLLKHPIYSFAYPYGKIPDHHQKMLTQAGYYFGLSIYTALETKYTLRRFAINETDDRKIINMKLSRRYRLMRALYDPVLLLKNQLAKD
ncbi:polysaccharide deacetylase [Pedobacter psychrotolerans]|uniref:Polysaccharide deacetylase n=1 Tax=Pedobacter psychrotolerans TaxID=1843235 RepID=A0A4V2RZK3_9SPHI|nr:polysaccharide deacetylase family protein [Pedobacter psychrotolerans]TCO26698.1 polysaccharide deacetylase [Pedobacter psychrotolerans]GGE55808.1 polysaccharide deacetylase [Pedobacter psychrotolerans]